MTPALNRDITNVHATKLNKGAGGGRVMFFLNHMRPNPNAISANQNQPHVDSAMELVITTSASMLPRRATDQPKGGKHKI